MKENQTLQSLIEPLMLKALLSFTALFYLITVVSAAPPLTNSGGSLTPSRGFSLIGSKGTNNFGSSLSGVGDINNDGIDDILISSTSVNGVGYYQLFVLFGQRDGFNDIDLRATDLATTHQGFEVISSNVWLYFGVTMSRAGDVNNDGIDDMLFGAAQTSSSNIAGIVVFGGRDIHSNVDLTFTNLAASQKGFILTASVVNCQGGSVSTAGDINNDGINDIIVANYGNNGYAFIYFGRSEGLTDLDMGNTDLAGSKKGFKITISNGLSTQFGKASGCVGDINNDGIDDIALTAPGTSSSTGIVYIFYGKKSGFVDINLDTVSLSASNLGFQITGESTGSKLGFSVSRAGDVNNDGIDDLLIGAYGANSKGAVYVIFGKNGGHADINLATSLSTTQQGFKISGASTGDQLGYSVSDAGDLKQR